MKILRNPFALGDASLTPFCQRVQQLYVQHMKKKTRKCDTEGFVPVASLNDVVAVFVYQIFDC